MKSPIVICAFALVLCAAPTYVGADPWLSIVKSENGFLFQGHLDGTGFSFDIPGDQIMVAEQEHPSDPARTPIDNIFFAVMPVRKSDFPSTSPDILISYRKSEQQYQKEHFGQVVLSDLDVCRGATLRHESWMLKTLDLKAPAQVFMAVKAGNYVIVVSSAFANADEKEEMLSKFSGLCKSFKIAEAE
jgi:hypothetical protein